MSKSKLFEVERITEHTQRVVVEELDFEDFICSPCTDCHDINVCDIELNPSIHPTVQDTKEKTRKGERPKISTGAAALQQTSVQMPMQQTPVQMPLQQTSIQMPLQMPMKKRLRRPQQ